MDTNASKEVIWQEAFWESEEILLKTLQPNVVRIELLFRAQGFNLKKR